MERRTVETSPEIKRILETDKPDNNNKEHKQRKRQQNIN